AERLRASHNAWLELGDIAPGYDHCGPIEETIDHLRWDKADLFILSETLEHLNDPDRVLRQIRNRTDMLKLSTPVVEDNDYNPQPVWGWSSAYVLQPMETGSITPH